MNFNWKMVCTGFAAAILLTACGTENSDQQDGVNPATEEQVSDETNGSSTGGTSTDKRTVLIQLMKSQQITWRKLC